MKGTFAIAMVLSGLVGTAAADNNAPLDAPDNPLVTPWSQPARTIRWVAEGVPAYNGFDQVQNAAGFSNVIYLNNCKPNGCVMKPGNDNSTTNTSQLINQQSNVQAFAYSDAVWQQVLTCVQETYSPFGVSVVGTRPTSGGYHMAIVAGSPGNIGESNGVGGVSPFGCGYLPNAISYSFANIYGPNVDEICATISQETAHSWGLEHKYDAKDPMTYLTNGPSRKMFQNTQGSCGEYQMRACDCGTNGMNSYAMIMDTFGGSTPTPPTVHITQPANNATNLQPAFPITSTATDDVGISKVELRIDNVLINTLDHSPFVWNAPATLAQGMHTIEITAYDYGNTPAKDTVHASVGMPCSAATECANATDVCVDGRCVLGGGAGGGLGTSCTANTECASGQCANDGTSGYCVEPCDPALDGCPSGFSCTAATGGTGGVCWPGGDGGGCSTSGKATSPTAPIFLGLGIAALVLTRRRRRA